MQAGVDMAPAKVLITGGAGYIGSTIASACIDRGITPVILDSLVTGFRQAVVDCPLVVGNVGDRQQVLAVNDRGCDAFEA